MACRRHRSRQMFIATTAAKQVVENAEFAAFAGFKADDWRLKTGD
jgi:hypothetical protein